MTRKDAGLSLIELLITLTVATLILGLGVPAFNSTAQRLRVQTTMHLISADLAMARSSAIMRRTQVVACPRTAEHRCRSDSDWSHGWMVFTDSDGNRQPDTPAHILRITDPPGRGHLAIGSTRSLLRYQHDGRSAHSNQTVRVCTDRQLAGTVVVNNLGRVRTARPAKPTPCPLD